ncbi:hypothetical protein Srufu_066170 [Streptomyces libani subsp. rufus]|nr:hypothetical protein Srufu_066170 [Streptomyces libani subsp. rufus]
MTRCNRAQYQQACRIRPVKVVQHHQDRSRRTQLVHQAEERLDGGEVHPGRSRGCSGRAQPALTGQDVGDAHPPGVGGRRVHAEAARDRRERQAPLDLLRRSGEHLHAQPPGVPRGLGHQGGLADARFPVHEQRLPVAGGGGFQETGDPLELGRAADTAVGGGVGHDILSVPGDTTRDERAAARDRATHQPVSHSNPRPTHLVVDLFIARNAITQHK